MLEASKVPTRLVTRGNHTGEVQVQAEVEDTAAEVPVEEDMAGGEEDEATTSPAIIPISIISH